MVLSGEKMSLFLALLFNTFLLQLLVDFSEICSDGVTLGGQHGVPYYKI